jgi:cystathionine gamma-lyase
MDDARLFDLLHADVVGRRKGDPVPPPVVFAAKYHLPGDPAEAAFQYGRFHNPTWSALERLLAVLEGAEACCFPSGMAASAAVLYASLKQGERILLPADGYYTTRALADRFLKPLGVAVETAATADYSRRDFAGLALVWIETPTNPGLDVCDIAEVAGRAHRAGARVVVDNTTMTPLGQRPLELGADVVVAAGTKAIAGHADVLAGHVATRDPATIAAIRDWRKLAGAVMGPMEAFLVHRGLLTLELRYSRMCASAAAIAPRLAAHAKVVAVRYPGLAADPAHAIAKRQMQGFGFMIGLTLSDAAAAEKFLSSCRGLVEATSFGGIHSSGERRKRWGDAVPEGFIRLAIGCEPTEALWAEINAALDRL